MEERVPSILASCNLNENSRLEQFRRIDPGSVWVARVVGGELKSSEDPMLYAVFGCTELSSVLNWQWNTKSTISMEYHFCCLDVRGIHLWNQDYNGILNPVWMYIVWN